MSSVTTIMDINNNTLNKQELILLAQSHMIADGNKSRMANKRKIRHKRKVRDARRTSNRLTVDEEIMQNAVLNYELGNHCCICLNVEVDFNKHVLPCGHSFHEMCIANWFRYRDACPVCLQNPETNEVLSSQQDDRSRTYIPCEQSDSQDSDIMIYLYDKSDSDSYMPVNKNHVGQGRIKKKMNRRRRVRAARPTDYLALEEKVLKGVVSNYELNINCSICLNTVFGFEEKNLSCGHSFHSPCIANWMDYSDSCPICGKSPTSDVPFCDKPESGEDSDVIIDGEFMLISDGIIAIFEGDVIHDNCMCEVCLQ